MQGYQYNAFLSLSENSFLALEYTLITLKILRKNDLTIEDVDQFCYKHGLTHPIAMWVLKEDDDV